MRQLNRLILVTAGLAFGISAANAAGIGPGSPAPALDVKTWYKGKAVKDFEPGKIYVVEFWATWCGPCIDSIPHVTKLAKANKDVTFIGVSIWEDEDSTKIKKFIDDMGDKMDYNVGYSGNKTGMSVTWMEAAAQNGIPAAFIVKDKQIQWVGHPMNMDKPLEEVKNGTFDLKAFKVKFDQQAEASRQQMAAGKEVAKARALVTEGKFAEAKTQLDSVEAKYPAMKPQLASIRFALLAKENPTAWDAQAKALAAKKDPQSIQTLWMYGMDQTQKGGDMASGAKAMDYALEAAEDKDFFTLYYGTMFFDKAKEYKKALALVEKSLALLPSTQFKDNVKVKEMLDKMKTDLAQKANAG
jgi:thiol-disulfide isomerase/thioredoxin